MKHKKGVAFYVFLGIAFSIVYIILAAQPIGREHQFIPQWKLELNAQMQKADASGEKPLYFKLGQTMGYFTESGTLLSVETFPFKAAISERYYAPYNTYGSSIDFFKPDGEKAGTINESGFPLFDEDRIFVFLAGGASFVECNSDGKRMWEYNGTVPITAFDSSPSGCVAGFADGTVRQFSADGTMIQKFSPGGSDYQVILGAALSSDGSMIALISGQNRQRFVLMKKYDAQTKIVFHEYIAQSSPLQRLVQFSKDGSVVWYNYKDTLGIVDTKGGKASHLAIRGQAISLQESGDLVFVLTKDDVKYTVYIIEKFDTMNGSFSFDAETAFIRTDGDNLFVGKDSSVSRIRIAKN